MALKTCQQWTCKKSFISLGGNAKYCLDCRRRKQAIKKGKWVTYTEETADSYVTRRELIGFPEVHTVFTMPKLSTRLMDSLAVVFKRA